jgi:hypothetical protein
VSTPTITRDDLWKQYEISVDLYKHYLKLAIEINVLYYAVTGALLSYYFAHKADGPIRFALVLPLLMSVMLGGLFIYGAILNRISRAEMFRVRDGLRLQAAPDFAVLSWFLSICATLMLSVSVGLAALISGWVSVA